MNILLIGSGGREAAMAFVLNASPEMDKLFVSPGNDSLREIAECVPKMDNEMRIEFCQQNSIDLVIFGGETELVAGEADPLRAAGFDVLGASAAAAALEGSKDFLKSVLFDAGVPCAASESFTELEPAIAYLSTRHFPIVLKTDGLAGGKGVVICETPEEAQDWLKRYLSGEAFGAAGQCVIIEDFLIGDEISFFVLVDANGHPHPLAAARDHKRIFDQDKGPNTGGMGAYTPVVAFHNQLRDQVMHDIIEPSLREMERRGAPFCGFLFAGLMLTDHGPKLLEYNVRLGDPETQVILANLPVDFARLCKMAAAGSVDAPTAATLRADQEQETRINVVMAAQGYPESPQKDAMIMGLDALENGRDFYHAGTRFDQGWRVNGGRVLNIVGVGSDIRAARQDAYDKVEKINFEGAQYRRDIGQSEPPKQ